MRTIPTCLAFTLVFLFIAGWRAFYLQGNQPYPGLVCLSALAGLSLAGGYRVSIVRRRAMIEASIEAGSRLRSILTGRIGSALRAILGTAATVPVVAYMGLVASGPELFLAAAAAAWALAMALVLERSLAAHVKPRFRLGMVAPAAIWIAALPVIAMATWFSYAVMPVPDFAQVASLTEALDEAMGDLPRHNPLLFELLSALRAADATVYWVLARDGFQALLPLGLFLVKGAVSYVSITKVAVDCQAALHGTADR